MNRQLIGMLQTKVSVLRTEGRASLQSIKPLAQVRCDARLNVHHLISNRQ